MSKKLRGATTVLPAKPAKAKPTVPWQPPTGVRKWLYRLVAITVVPTILLGGLELGLRVSGYGHPTSFFVEGVGAEAGEPTYIENIEFGRRFFPSGLIHLRPLPLAMPRVKPKGSCRVFILGESAAMGFPDPAYGFSRILNVMLCEACPDKRFEIVNTAMTAINSHVVLPIARECAEHQPDFYVVHLGNNEVVGTFGAAGVLGKHAPALGLIRANLFVKKSRTGELLANTMQWLSPGNSPKTWDGMTMFLESKVAADDPRLLETHANFRRNLHDICHAGLAAGAKILVCTIPVNLKDCGPFASLHAANLGDERLAAWDQAYQAGVALEDAGKPADALRRYDEATAIDDRFADLAYRQGRCWLALGNVEEAAKKYRLALDLDALRFRSDSKINAIIRDVVAGLPADTVRLIDGERDFAACSPDGLAGEDLFYEHVHMNFKGNYVLAAPVFRAITEALSAPVAPLTEAQCAERLALVPWNRVKAETNIRDLMLEPPFTQQLDSQERRKRWDKRIEEAQTKCGPEDLKKAQAVYLKALEHSPHDWVIRENYAQLLIQLGAPEQAVEQYYAVLKQVPHYHVGYRQFGKLLFNVGNIEGAKACYESALAIDPDWAPNHYNLATVLAAQGKKQDAITLFTRRVNRESNRAEALALLANFLFSVGEPEEARKRLDEALQFDPKDATANLAMGHLLVKEGAFDQAISHYEAVVRRRPGSAAMVSKILAKLPKSGANPK